MLLDIEQVEQVGGGPGTVRVMVRGRARHDGPAPVLLVDTAEGRFRLPSREGGELRSNTAFAASFEVPLHLACAAVGWWLAPADEATAASGLRAARSG